MQITSGALKGRQFFSPASRRSRPMAERIRNALFNSLGELSGLDVLDAFGGSGALSFEAVSRGAKYVTVCESDPRAAKIIAANINHLELTDSVKLVRQSVYRYLITSAVKYDLIIADPPFDRFKADKLASLAAALRPGGTLAVSLPSNQKTPDIVGMRLCKRSIYGRAALAFYKIRLT